MEIVNEHGKPVVPQHMESKRIVAGVLAIVLGGIGVHKFVLNYNKEGIILLSVTVGSFILMCLIIGMFTVWIPGLIGFIEGIIYLTKSDEEFIEIYQKNYKPWF
ncbi:TM2 domain-containing membrane protein YozV [Tenacibaculum sp. MAR_2009_124]|uniref:TM2 domain-containing protein n=1 Tax=Tenacibaculum sp. MAR_2009_124 TaxID=1250059 RepID=UPI00089C1C03|nr:TM2 domain-containing protein [Tenacibaculum sp. MAR_2009_124]SEB96749.1 TM2 domain-containing membrane protein YozV [Tenacibaculum sp. MAR_2009_124]